MNKLALIIFVFCTASMLSCKKKGCSDKFAINYNIVAEKDDGSCVYCTETQVDKGQLTHYLVDDISGSQYQGQQILRIDVSGYVRSYNDLSCGDEFCFANITLTNLIGSNISYIDFKIYIYPIAGSSWYYDHTNNGGGSIPQGGQFIDSSFPVNSSCGSLIGATVNDNLWSVSYN